MQKVFEKIIENLESYKHENIIDQGSMVQLHCRSVGHCREKNCFQCVFDRAIEIVKQVEAKHNNGWIPCGDRLPEEPKENPIFEGKNLELYLVTTKYGSNEQDKVYPFRAFWNGVNFTDGWHILDVIAWQPLPDPYQPKGE